MTDMDGVTLLPKGACPYCGHTLNAAGTADGSPDTPAEGDATVCIKCAQVLFYQADMTPRKPKAGELETILIKEPEWAKDIAAMQRRVQSVPWP